MSSNLTTSANVPNAQQIEAGAALYDISHPAQADKPKAAVPIHTPATAETVNNAIRWYRQNRGRIAGQTISTTGVQFGPRWATATLEPKIERWEAGALGLALAVAYILNPLRTIKTEMSKQNG